MSAMKIFAPVMLACLMLLSFATGVAQAADEPPAADAPTLEHSLACDGGVCSLRLDLGDNAPGWLPATGFALSVLESNLRVLPDGAGISVSEGLSLDLPIGNLKLADAEIDLTMSPDGQVESFHGTAQLPTPSIGILSRAGGSRPIATALGFDYASRLPAISAQLDPEKKYLYFDLAAGIELSAALGDEVGGELWLSIPEGQRATVVIDPRERFAFIDGNVTLRYSGSMAFLTQMLDPAQTVDLLSGELPVRHEATVHVTGVLTDRLEDSQLEFAGRYAVDGGKIAEWLNIDGEPLALEGGIVISDAGLLGTGILRSSVLPENVWNSAMQAQVFVPFSTDLREAYAALDTRLDIPFADVSAGGYARLDGKLDVIAEGRFDVPWRAGNVDSVALAEAGAPPVEVAVSVEKTDLAPESADAGDGRLSRAWEATTDGARTGLEYAQRPAGAAYDWVKEAAGAGYDSAAGGLEWSVDLASSKWCATTGLCRGRGQALDAEGVTAMR